MKKLFAIFCVLLSGYLFAMEEQTASANIITFSEARTALASSYNTFNRTLSTIPNNTSTKLAILRSEVSISSANIFLYLRNLRTIERKFSHLATIATTSQEHMSPDDYNALCKAMTTVTTLKHRTLAYSSRELRASVTPFAAFYCYWLYQYLYYANLRLH